uniref:Ig-like domain-containing protein n=1 Tax=Xiphophorus maculatus TaxID=8083 RepID=A0A3B5R5D6_XIPMA
MLLVLFLPPGAPSAYQVLQSPRFAAPKPGESVTVHCSHNVSIFERILWYKREKHGNLQSKYSAVKDTIETGALTVKDLQPDDSGVYFCAVSKHSDVRKHNS